MKKLFTILAFWTITIASFSSLAQTPDINVKFFSTNVPNNAGVNNNYGTIFSAIPLSNATLSTDFTLENRGGGTLTISAIDITGTGASDFTVGNSPSTTLAPNATTTLRITFNPSVADRRTATVTITSNDPDESPFRINLLGFGIEPEMDVFGNGNPIANGSSTPITNNHTHFGAEFVTGGSIVRTFTIENNESAALNLTGTPTKVAITGTHASDFTLTAAPSSPVPRFESTTFQITFNPSGSGVRTALLTIANDDEDERPYTFAVEGVGTVPSSSADYTISTANSTITITDVNGNGETMEVSESNSNVRFFVSGRTYSIDGGAVTPFTTPADIAISSNTGIVVNTNAGNDIITVGAFTSALPSLTINAGVGDDIVNMNGNITFAANANLDIDLQNDDNASPGRDVVNIGTNANVVLAGTGSATIKVSQNVFVNTGGGLTTANGNLVVEANQQGTPTSGNFMGVRFNDLNSLLQVTGSGLLTVKGKGGDIGNAAYGIYMGRGGKIIGGTNTVTVEGVGGPTSSFGGYGVDMIALSEIRSTGGNIIINGTGNGSAINSGGLGLGYDGVYVRGTISAGGTGNVTITGRGSLNNAEESLIGVRILEGGVTTAGGNLTINGYGGGSGNTPRSTGIVIASDASVSSGGMGTLTLNGEGGVGTGNGNNGVILYGVITSGGGNVIVTGKEGGGTGSYGIVIANTIFGGSDGEINTSANGGDILLRTNSFFSDANTLTLITSHLSNKVTFLPLTNGVGINFVSTSDVVGGPITISDLEFDNITGGAIHFGDANTGIINVNDAITHAAGNIHLTTGQALNLNQSFGAGTGNININAAGGINPKSTTVDLSGNTISFTSGNNLNIAIGGTTVNTEYDQLNIQGAIDLTGLNLVLSGSYVPVAGNTFTIVNNDGTDAIVGTFNGLAQGATIPNFRGSGLNATISYTGGTDNNDMVITVAAPAVPEINLKGNSVSIVSGDNSPIITDHTDFGPVSVPSGSVTRTFTIENTGAGALTLGTITGGTTDFTITQPLLTSIPANGSTTFTVTFDPTTTGKRTATISIPNNDADENPYTFAIEGYGGKPFITTWQTDKDNPTQTSIIIPTTGTGYSYDVDWNNDGIYDQFGLTGNVTHDYGTANTYMVAIRGAFPRIFFDNDGANNQKLLSVNQWGDIDWKSFERAFLGCGNLQINASDKPDLNDVTNMSGTFSAISAINQDISAWDVSSVENMSSMFSSVHSFNQNISNWNVSKVTNMSGMFAATAFNQDISGWDVSKVTNMSFMFGEAAFNQNISGWDVSKVTNMTGMFLRATAFNQSLAAWGTKFNASVNLDNFLDNCGMDEVNYDATLIGFNQGTATGRSLGALGLKYCTAQSARTNLTTTKNWTITGDAQNMACISPDYTITTTGGNIVITDAKGTGETLEVSENSGKIRFNVTGKTYNIDAGATTAFTTPAEVVLSGKNSITINTAGGNDIINVGAFTTQLPTLTINGGTGDDQVNMNGDITFVANANLDLDLQNDDANAGVDVIILNTDANLSFSGTGAITLKSSKNIETKSGSSLAAVGGNILIEANQQTSPSTGNFKGVEVIGTIQTTGIGTITLKGKGGTDASNAQTGVKIGGTLTSNTGEMMMEGNGGAGAGNDNHGIEVAGNIAGTTAKITLTGTGGGTGTSSNNKGVSIGSSINTSFGSTSINAITITGVGGNTTGNGNDGVYSTSNVMATGTTGSISLIGTAGNTLSAGISIVNGTINARRTTNLTSDNVAIANTASVGNITSGTVALNQRTDNTPINLGTETVGSLSFTSQEMNRIFADEIYIGNATTGPITVSAPIAPANISATCRITLQSSSDLTISGGGITTLGGNVRFRVANIYPTFSGMDVSMGTTGVLSTGSNNRFVFDINGPAANTGYTQLHMAGNLSLYETRLTLTGNYTPSLGQTFMIINNTGTDPIDHVFLDYAEGYIFNNFLGSGQNAKITYVGGDGNDVVLTVVAAPIFTDSPDNQVVCAGNSASFTVASSNAASYKWQARSNSGSNWADLTNVSPYSNVATSTLSISDVTGLNNYQYRCVATNDIGSTNSDPATLTVTPLPSATINYSGSPFAQNVAPVSVNRTGTAGGGYTASPTGLTIDNQTGQITPSSSLINNYVVTYTIAASGGCAQFTTTASVEIVAAPTPDYTITTTGGNIVITDAKGIGETLEVSENSGKIRFNVTGKTYSIDAGATTAFTTPAEVVLSGKNSITVNTAGGNDIINVGAFTTQLPTLTINGGTGDDEVNMNGDITFVANANLDLDLQNDDANAGVDALTIAANANLILSGTGTATVKVSKNITMNAGSSLVTQNGNIGLITNSIDIQSGAAVSTSTASSITLRPYTDGVAVDLGAATNPLGGPLTLTDAELDRITTGTIHVGNANSGAITVSAAISRPANTAMNLTSGGAVNFNASSLNLNGGNLSINAAGGINPTAAGEDINVGTASVTSGNDLNIVINGPTVDTDYRQLKIGGSMSLNGVDLVLTTSNGFVPTIGQTFTIVQRNNLPGAITGRFNGLEYGALITNFLGSGLNAYITYAQTTVVLTVVPNTPDYTITTANGQMIITDVAGNGEALAMSENGTNIHIENSTLGRTFSLNGGPVAIFPTDIPLGGITDITINAGNGDDNIPITSFTQLFPSLTVNGDAGNDVVVVANLHFAPGAHLNLDLQNDPGTPGEDEISINASVVLSGSGTAVLKASAGVYLANLTTENGDIVIEVNQQAVPLAAATGFLMQDNTVQITGTGALTIKAARGQTDGPAIQTFGSSVLSTNSGNLTIEGYAGTGTGSGNKGIDSKARFSSVNGDIFIKGVGGGSGSSTDNQGIFLNNIAGGIKTTGSGSITLIGTGGNSTGSDNDGIHINSPFIESAAGDVSLTGYSNANSTPVALNNTPVRTLSAGKTIQINADDISYAGTISTTGANSSVTLKPTTAGRAVTLGTDVPNTLNLSSAELGAISTYRLNIGDANTGAITNNAAQTLSAISNSVALTTGGALNLNASSFGIGSANLLINAAGGINPTTAGTDVNIGTVSFASGNDLAISINGTTADTDYRQLNVAGSVNLSGLDLVLSGSHVPVLGQTFVIVNNDGSDAIQGTFNGLPEGSTIAPFLGGQLNARISYVGGDGNDAVLTVIASVEPPTNTANVTICKNATASLTASCAVGQVTWYNAAGTTQLFVGSPLVTSALTASTGYKVRCELAPQLSGFVNVMVTVVVPPTITLTTLQQTLNEGNNPVLCDTDANPVNSLQFNVTGLCVVGNPVWRVQVGSGAWSAWSTSAPVSQPSNNQPHRYQAACDANCASTYSGVIELTINNRASVPQNVSLLVDGVTVAVGETKEVCSLVTTSLTFNANCAAGEMILYSVDGGEYSAGVPVGLVDNQYHNYRVRCRKSDGTPSCVESESGVMRLKLVTIPSAPTVSLSSTSSCNPSASFSGQSTCGSLRTVWYNATTNVALPSLPSTVPSQTTSYYARCQTENGCVSEKS
ncbi:MAG TPA: hypothetical protein DCM71_15135, partial [Runella sp.]|nr:hypothetical protein [Runella sp.]